MGSVATVVDVPPEYHIWKKNSRYLYDFLATSQLPWPSLTVQWMPDLERRSSEFNIQRLLLGTRTSEQSNEYVRVARLTIPQREAPDMAKYDQETGEIGEYKAGVYSMSIIEKMDHHGEVNKARYMPQNPDVIATMSSDHNCYLFDRRKHPSQPTGYFEPEMTLSGHSGEGYGLSWNSHTEGQLLTSAANEVRFWDLSAATSISPSSTCLLTLESAVNDVQWHPAHPAVLGSVSDDCKFRLTDTRVSEQEQESQVRTDSADGALNCLSFNPFNEFLVALGSESSTVSLWDIRNLKSSLQDVKTPDSVISMEWNPHDDLSTILCASFANGQVTIYDAGESSQDPALFTHGGHTSAVTDLSWNPFEPWMLATVADNILHVWKPTELVTRA